MRNAPRFFLWAVILFVVLGAACSAHGHSTKCKGCRTYYGRGYGGEVVPSSAITTPNSSSISIPPPTGSVFGSSASNLQQPYDPSYSAWKQRQKYESADYYALGGGVYK